MCVSLLLLLVLAVPSSPQNFTYFAPLSGFTSRRYYFPGDACTGAVFREAVERVGACLIKYDDDGTTIVGSTLNYLCHDLFCFEYDRFPSNSTDDSIAIGGGTNDSSTPAPSMRPTRLPTRRPGSPSKTPTPVPSKIPTHVPTVPSWPFDYYDNYTSIPVQVDYYTPDCKGTDLNTNTTILNHYPEQFLHSGLCRHDPFTGLYFSETFELQAVKPPAFSISGAVFAAWSLASDCRAGQDPVYSTVELTDVCIPGHYINNMRGSSVRVVDNLDWLSLHYYNESADCSGGRAVKSDEDRTVSCLPPRQRVIMTEHSIALEKATYSRYVTSSSPLDSLLTFFRAVWIVRIAMASLASLCGLLMLAILIDLSKWNDFNRIIFALSLTQLGFDVSCVTEPFRHSLVQEVVVISSASYYRSYAANHFVQ